MVQEWEPGTQYNIGDVVAYEGKSFRARICSHPHLRVHPGHRYKIIQAHRSQSDWTPPVTPALWGRIPEEERQHHEHREHHEPRHDQPPPPQQCGGNEKPWDQHTQQQVPIHEDERKHGWDGLSDERKKQIEVGGGLALGLAAIGAGVFGYKMHEKNEEEKKAHVWALQNWIHEGEQRTREYYEGRTRAPATWILIDGKDIPTNIAIAGGQEHGQPHYICRAFHEGSLQIGKASPIFEKGGVIGYAHKEFHMPKFEVLVGDPRAIRWIDMEGRFDPEKLGGARPVEGGREADGTPLYVAQGMYNNAIIPGKCSTHLSAAFVPYAQGEKEVKHYRVLCWA
ncbi:carbohydrate-binding module family 12 protein [Epithele typhae]|uniref:carbohydrate-binding module family 12 protein n=1 Tax=Epithele typhae TaxID=378194 RepID=UPI00200803F4|nr:carbohydrate-binding module family 12 protein [Epithele typhae]KAH9924314.1 carbohydrate-binding module family 12 protein [Epithele typhae]